LIFSVQPLYFLDEFLVDLQTTRSIEENGVAAGRQSGGQCGRADRRHIARNTVGVKCELLLFGKNLQLVDGGRPVDIAGRHQRTITALFEQFAELGGRGGFAGTVQTDQQNLQRAHPGERGRTFAEQADEFVVDDLDDLLPGGDGLEHVLANALLLHAFDKFTGDPEMDVGREEGGPHFLQRCRHVFFGKFADDAQIAEGAAEFVGKGFEHGKRN